MGREEGEEGDGGRGGTYLHMGDIRSLKNTIEEKRSWLHRLRIDSISHIQNRETIGRESLKRWRESRMKRWPSTHRQKMDEWSRSLYLIFSQQLHRDTNDSHSRSENTGDVEEWEGRREYLTSRGTHSIASSIGIPIARSILSESDNINFFPKYRISTLELSIQMGAKRTRTRREGNSQEKRLIWIKRWCIHCTILVIDNEGMEGILQRKSKEYGRRMKGIPED